MVEEVEGGMGEEEGEEEGWDGRTLHRMATSQVGLSVLKELFW